MNKANSLEHALHNEKACNYLDKKKEFTDWVITTAFYSSLHFVNYKIFPFKEGNIEYTSLDIYHSSVMTAGRKISKHGLLCELVRKRLVNIAPDYRHLKDISNTARYVDYKHHRYVSNYAKTCLKNIKESCSE